jgi:hypothetical protein
MTLLIANERKYQRKMLTNQMFKWAKKMEEFSAQHPDYIFPFDRANFCLFKKDNRGNVVGTTEDVHMSEEIEYVGTYLEFHINKVFKQDTDEKKRIYEVIM